MGGPIWRFMRILGFIFLLLAFFSGARAEDREKELSTVKQQLEQSISDEELIAGELEAAIAAQEEVSAKLIEISRKAQEREAAVSASEEELKRLSLEQAEILARLGEKQDALSELLAGLQRLEQNPPPALVVNPDDVLGALRGAMMFGAIVPELRGEAEALAQDLTRLDALKTTVKARKQEMQAEIASLDSLGTELTGLIARKQELVAASGAKLTGERERAAVLAKQAQSLQQLLTSLAAERVRAEAERTRKLAAKEAERARQAAADLAERTKQLAAAEAERARQLAAEEAERAKQMAALEAEQLRRDMALQAPKLDFAKAKAQLSYPAEGQLVRKFGDKDGLGGSSEGTVIATRAGAQVIAPADGKVEFAGPFRTYGEVLIINAGGGYHILLAGMEKITAGMGEFLRAGEPVGRMGNGPSSVTLLGDVVKDGRPVLYIEFRNKSEAIDSGPWWTGGTREARG